MTTYLYIDDDKLLDSQGKVNGFQKAGSLEVKVENNTTEWKKQIDRLKRKDYDGLILDLKLDETPVEDGCRAEFRGSSLAQQVRDYQKEGILPALPILLYSAEDKIKSSLDSTGHDLFDLCIEKTEMDVETMLALPTQLIDLSDCYKRLNQKENVVTMLCAIYPVDERFTNTLTDLQQDSSVAACVHLLLHEFILKPGLLVDESLLAARLGVDMKKSSVAWPAILNLFDKARYQGTLCNGWKRWWMRGVNDIWRDMAGGQYLQMMDAKERVDVLKKMLGIDTIVPAELLRYSESRKFWAVCRGTDAPLDPADGFVIAGQEPHYPWQDFMYVSKKAAFLKINNQRWKNVASSEKTRLEMLKQEYEVK